jgi:hypothetical protein
MDVPAARGEQRPGTGPRPGEVRGTGGPAPGVRPGTGSGPGEVPSTGDPRVDEAVSWLAGLAGLPVPEHPRVLGQVEERLTEVLADAGAPPEGPPETAG